MFKCEDEPSADIKRRSNMTEERTADEIYKEEPTANERYEENQQLSEQLVSEVLSEQLLNNVMTKRRQQLSEQLLNNLLNYSDAINHYQWKESMAEIESYKCLNLRGQDQYYFGK
ncbi:protein transport protein Sec24-like-like [Dorcoceras hygrometricum]|uniref:Protein transport protein Sec24-like-like n=1 Tax=Dorcoceras hygrometricum TaxID=472368 RepID=A0A2Z7BWJ7_9LAMI|nr:protein transport protein Sec24-like-like [Dorcoceras hygrometricum]